jgi:hypothetical protein
MRRSLSHSRSGRLISPPSESRPPKLKLALTAGIGFDHVDLDAAIKAGITVAEVTYCNSISVAEHVGMMILSLVRSYLPSHEWATKGGWNIADCVQRSYDVEGMPIGTRYQRKWPAGESVGGHFHARCEWICAGAYGSEVQFSSAPYPPRRS